MKQGGWLHAHLRLLLGMMVGPVLRVIDRFQRHADNVLSVHLSFGRSRCTVRLEHKATRLDHELLVATYLLFVARYFFVCDLRQVGPVKSCLLSCFSEEGATIQRLTQAIYDEVFKTLGAAERWALEGLFQDGNPPMTFSEDDYPEEHSLATYSFLVFGAFPKVHATFHISQGPDIVLLPIALGIVYQVVSEKLTAAENEALRLGVLRLLKAYDRVDCRSVTALTMLPNEILEAFIGEENSGGRKAVS